MAEFDPGQLLQRFNRDLEAMGTELSGLLGQAGADLDSVGQAGAENIRSSLMAAMDLADRARSQVEGALMSLGRIRPGEYFTHGGDPWSRGGTTPWR